MLVLLLTLWSHWLGSTRQQHSPSPAPKPISRPDPAIKPLTPSGVSAHSWTLLSSPYADLERPFWTARTRNTTHSLLLIYDPSYRITYVYAFHTLRSRSLFEDELSCGISFRAPDSILIQGEQPVRHRQ